MEGSSDGVEVSVVMSEMMDESGRFDILVREEREDGFPFRSFS